VAEVVTVEAVVTVAVAGVFVAIADCAVVAILSFCD
jgi:hypothetical protein